MRKSILFAAICGLGLPVLSVSAQDKINFEKQIYPFIKSGCIQCHRPEHENPERPGRKVKPKGGYVFTNAEALMAAADEDSGKKFIVPGKPDESLMLHVVRLPLDDDKHYPPEGKAPQWTDAEKELFAKWIAEGADFGEWKEDADPLTVPEWDGKEKAAGTTETAK
ncbi:MAG TPA: hypothetical protein PLA50_08980 [Bacteroidia bacterium]|nr:hypothetical protein [Bacteroidia bacterium]